MRDGGKGDTPRPLGVSIEEFDNAWDRIFNKSKKEVDDIFTKMHEENEKLAQKIFDEMHEKECGK